MMRQLTFLEDLILPPRAEPEEARDFLRPLEKYGAVIGTDEVGRGALAGPVVACAVSLTPEQEERLIELGLKDSKRLSPKKREMIFGAMEEMKVKWRAFKASNKFIDQNNILNASLSAMRESVLKLAGDIDGKISCVVVDGINELPELGLKQWALIRADDLVPCVSAASVAAKVLRDRLMIKMSSLYPDYGFEKNKGYPTMNHMETVKRLGLTDEHRLTFCRKILQERGNFNAADKR